MLPLLAARKRHGEAGPAALAGVRERASVLERPEQSDDAQQGPGCRSTRPTELPTQTAGAHNTGIQPVATTATASQQQGQSPAPIHDAHDGSTRLYVLQLPSHLQKDASASTESCLGAEAWDLENIDCFCMQTAPPFQVSPRPRLAS